MDHKGFAELLSQLADNWTAKRYEEVAGLFTNRLFYSDAINYAYYDRTALLAFFRDDGEHPQLCVFHNSIFDFEKQLGVAEYSYKGHFLYHGTVWIKLDGDKISVWREYQHRSDQPHSAFWKIDERDHH